MTAIDNTPDNLNLLSPLNFKFLIKKAPHVNFFIQKVNIPQIYLKPAPSTNPFVNLPHPGEHLEYSTLNITFKVDEDLQNYLEIHNWIRSLGKPHDFGEYKEIQDKPQWTGDGIYSDITVSILSNIKVFNYEVNYIDACPIMLSNINLNTTDTDIRYLEATASFKYTYFNVSRTV